MSRGAAGLRIGRGIAGRVAAVLLLLSASLVGCGRAEGGDDDDPARTRRAEPDVRFAGDTVFVDSASADLIGLTVGVPPHHPFHDWIETTGQIAPDRAALASVSAPAEGRIEAISVAPGDRVRRGQPLVTFRSPEYLAGSVQLRAPRGGIVTGRWADVGQFVQPGTPILEISDLSRVILQVDLFPEMLARVGPEMLVEAVVPGDSIRRTGTIAAVDAQVDSSTQAARARVPLANADGRLRPGTFARVRIRTRAGDEAVFVPAEAVVRDSAGQWVYTPAGKGYARRRVEAEAIPGDSMVLLGGVDPGRPLVVRGAYQLHQARFSFRGLVTFGEESEVGEASED